MFMAPILFLNALMGGGISLLRRFCLDAAIRLFRKYLERWHSRGPLRVILPKGLCHRNIDEMPQSHQTTPGIRLKRRISPLGHDLQHFAQNPGLLSNVAFSYFRTESLPTILQSRENGNRLLR